MKIVNLDKIELEKNSQVAYTTKLNIFRLNNIYPHEETIEDSNITYDIVRNSRLVLGAEFILEDDFIEIKDKLFILDGHHRFHFIKENKIDEEIDVVLIDLKIVSIESYNCKLLVNKEDFVNKIRNDHMFTNNKHSLTNPYITINKEKYFSDKIFNLKDLYAYKKLLMQKKIIKPIPNNLEHSSEIIQFSPLSYEDFECGYVFPYKSTWITPRFDNH